MAVVTTPADVARTTAADLEKRAGADVAGAVFKWTLIGTTTFATAFLAQKLSEHVLVFELLFFFLPALFLILLRKIQEEAKFSKCV